MGATINITISTLFLLLPWHQLPFFSLIGINNQPWMFLPCISFTSTLKSLFSRPYFSVSGGWTPVVPLRSWGMPTWPYFYVWATFAPFTKSLPFSPFSPSPPTWALAPEPLWCQGVWGKGYLCSLDAQNCHQKVTNDSLQPFTTLELKHKQNKEL